MTERVTGLFTTYSQAKAAVDELDLQNVPRRDLDVIAQEGVVADLEESADTEGEVKEGMAVGALAGVVAGASAVLIPGVGPLLVGGPIASVLATTGVAAAGGGLAGTLTSIDWVSEEEAEQFAEHIEGGGVVVSVETDRPDLVREIFAGEGASVVESPSAA